MAVGSALAGTKSRVATWSRALPPWIPNIQRVPCRAVKRMPPDRLLPAWEKRALAPAVMSSLRLATPASQSSARLPAAKTATQSRAGAIPPMAARKPSSAPAVEKRKRRGACSPKNTKSLVPATAHSRAVNTPVEPKPASRSAGADWPKVATKQATERAMAVTWVNRSPSRQAPA